MAEKGKTALCSNSSPDGDKKKIKAKIDPRIEQKISELRRKAKEHLSIKQFEEALRCLDFAIELHSTSYKLYRMRSIALSCLHQYERAAADADRVVELAPHIMDGHYHKGFALFHLKDYTGAAHAFQQGLKLNPTDKTLRQGFWDAIALVSQNRTDKDAPNSTTHQGASTPTAVTPVNLTARSTSSGANKSTAGGTPQMSSTPPAANTALSRPESALPLSGPHSPSPGAAAGSGGGIDVRHGSASEVVNLTEVRVGSPGG